MVHLFWCPKYICCKILSIFFSKGRPTHQPASQPTKQTIKQSNNQTTRQPNKKLTHAFGLPSRHNFYCYLLPTYALFHDPYLTIFSVSRCDTPMFPRLFRFYYFAMRCGTTHNTRQTTHDSATVPTEDNMMVQDLLEMISDTPVNHAGQWRPVRVRRGIHIWTSTVERSPYCRIRGRMRCEATPEQLLQLLIDDER